MIGHLPQPATSIIDEIKNRAADGPLSPFEFAQFRKKANALKSNDTENAFAALGILACLEGNLDECRKNHEMALLYAKSPSIQLSNYAGSLFVIGLHQESFDLAQKARAMDATNPAALEVCIRASFELGYEEQYLGYAAEWQKLTGEAHPTYALYLDEVQDANELTACCTHGALHVGGGC